MEHFEQQYKKRLDAAHAKIAGLKGTLATTSILRMIAFLAIGGSLVDLINQPPVWFYSVPLATIVAFLWLVKRFAVIQAKRNYYRAVAEINEEEIRRLNGDHEGLPDGRQWDECLYLTAHHGPC